MQADLRRSAVVHRVREALLDDAEDAERDRTRYRGEITVDREPKGGGLASPPCADEPLQGLLQTEFLQVRWAKVRQGFAESLHHLPGDA